MSDLKTAPLDINWSMWSFDALIQGPLKQMDGIDLVCPARLLWDPGRDPGRVWLEWIGWIHRDVDNSINVYSNMFLSRRSESN